MPYRARSWMLILALLPLACEGADPQGQEGAEGQDETDGQGDPCPPAVAGTPETYTVSLVGFPEVEDDAVVDPDGTLDFTGDCTITQLSFADGQLSLALACEHPDSTDASVTITTAASGIPIGLAVDDSVELSSYAYYNQGGDLGGGVFRALTNVNFERHTITDEQGVVFAALRGNTDGIFGSITIEDQFNCPGWTACSGDGDISGYIRASSGDGEIDVEIGEIEQLVDGALAWDVSLFQARLGGCHGNEGSFSVVRRS